MSVIVRITHINFYIEIIFNMKEILTLQFGHYSNFVGTHWWNIQERGFEYNTNQPSEINHDVLYREGFTDKVWIYLQYYKGKNLEHRLFIFFRI